MTTQTAEERYTRACRDSARQILSAYSTSFSVATTLLSPATRPHVAAIYALTRVADEIVDGAVTGSSSRSAMLHELRAETDRSVRRGHSPNPVVHAFAVTARQFGIDERLTDPFFDSMAADLDVTTHDEASLARYIHGSAEVVGEMCLRTFAGGALAGRPDMTAGAHALGSAFQKVNFLRDVREDSVELGRSYLPGRDPRALTYRDVVELADDVDAELAAARTMIAQIPGRDGIAVWVAHDLFDELNTRIRRAGPYALMAGRVRVPDAVKTRLVLRRLARSGLGGPR